ncbi:MAG: hypothetical protein J0I31_17590 [Rhizobiales bacterium]|nr:hypothetical protein [Hyphomicrobiales bacterium]
MMQSKSAGESIERITHNPIKTAAKAKAERKGGAVQAPLDRAGVWQRVLGLLPARTLELVKKLGLVGVAVATLNEAAVAAAPRYYEPAFNFVAEQLGFHREYFARTNEPRMRADGQGTLTARSHYLYELRLSDLTVGGLVSGRFHGIAQSGLPDEDPQWWLLRGYSDGKSAVLAYTSEDGTVLGRMVLTAINGGTTWRGTLTGLDPSISKEQLVQSPIVVASHRYPIEHGLDGDPGLEKASLLVDK